MDNIVTQLSSPDSLAALARTYTSFQRDIEQALYHTISIPIHEKVLSKCLETLAANSEKAAFVRFLTIERWLNCTNERKLSTYLTNALVNMHTLIFA